MEILSPLDVSFLKASLAGLAIFYTGSLVSRLVRPNPQSQTLSLHATVGKRADTSLLPPTRSIKKRFEQTGKRCMIFYGSQTGTAEKLALSLAKDLSTKLNLQSMAADLDDYDFSDLASMQSDKLVIFLLATYGEGEPTDNAIAFDSFLKTQVREKDNIDK